MRILLLTWSLLFSSAAAHPISESSKMHYTGPGAVLSEDRAAIATGGFSPPGQTGSQGPEEHNRDGLRSSAFIPVGSVEEGLMENSGALHPFWRFLGSRKLHDKRGNPTECFWKYCV